MFFFLMIVCGLVFFAPSTSTPCIHLFPVYLFDLSRACSAAVFFQFTFSQREREKEKLTYPLLLRFCPPDLPRRSPRRRQRQLSRRTPASSSRCPGWPRRAPRSRGACTGPTRSPRRRRRRAPPSRAGPAPGSSSTVSRARGRPCRSRSCRSPPLAPLVFPRRCLRRCRRSARCRH